MSLAWPRTRAWIGTVLNADATLTGLLTPGKVWVSSPAQGSLLPRVVLSHVHTGPIKVNGNTTIWADIVCQIVGIDRTTTLATLEAAMNRVDVLLDSASGTVVSGQVLFCSSGDEIAFEEPPDPGASVPYQHLGREWYIFGKSTA